MSAIESVGRYYSMNIFDNGDIHKAASTVNVPYINENKIIQYGPPPIL